MRVHALQLCKGQWLEALGALGGAAVLHAQHTDAGVAKRVRAVTLGLVRRPGRRRAAHGARRLLLACRASARLVILYFFKKKKKEEGEEG